LQGYRNNVLNELWPKVMENAAASQLRGTADYDPQSISRDEAQAVIATMRDFIAFAEKTLLK